MPDPEIENIKKELEKALHELKELKKAVGELEGDLRTLFENSPQACTEIIDCANRLGRVKDEAEKDKMKRCRDLVEKYELTIPE